MATHRTIAKRLQSFAAEADPRVRAAAIAFLCIVAFLTVFVVPWFIPIQVKPVLSDSQAAGFSNRAAMLGIGLSILCIGAIAWATAAPTQRTIIALAASTKVRNRVSRPLLGGLAALSAVTILVLGRLYGSYPISEGAYFTNRLIYLVAGYSPRSFEFSYGPLLLYPQYFLYAALKPIGVGFFTSYYIWAAAFYVFGLVLLAFVLNRLSLPSLVRNTVFALIAVAALVMPTLGLSYTLVRFLAPFALLLASFGLLCDEQRPGWIRVLAPAGAGAIAFLLSPELGVALWVALMAGAAVFCRGAKQWLWWSVGLLAVAGVGSLVLLSLLGGSTLGAFAGGAYYFPVLPGPMAVLYVLSLLAVAAFVTPLLRVSDLRARAVLLAWMIVAMILIAPAFGRADAAHMYWNGLGVGLLVITVLAQRRTWAAVLYAVTFVGIYAFATIALGLAAYLPQAVVSGAESGALSRQQVQAAANWPVLQQTGIDFDQIRNGMTSSDEEQYVLGLSRVAVPDPWGGNLLLELAQRKTLAPWYLKEQSISEAQTQLALNDLSMTDRLILPASTYNALLTESSQPEIRIRPGGFVDTSLYRDLMLIPVTLPARYPDYDPDSLFARAVTKNWTVEARSDRLVVLKRR